MFSANLIYSGLFQFVNVRQDGHAHLIANPAEYRKAAKQLSELEPLVEKFREYKVIDKDFKDAEEMAQGSDADMREMAQDELKSLTERRDHILEELKILPAAGTL